MIEHRDCPAAPQTLASASGAGTSDHSGDVHDTLDSPLSAELKPASSPKAGRAALDAAADRAAIHDTMLSAPAPADSTELDMDDRVFAAERQIRALTDRVERLERQRRLPPRERQALWWIGLLLALAALWLLQRAL